MFLLLYFMIGLLLFWLVIGRDIILSCYLGDVVRKIILLLFTGHATKRGTVLASIILLLFFWHISAHVARDELMIIDVGAY